MIAKYHIEYLVEFGRHQQPHHFQTDDPVAAEEFLTELLQRGLSIQHIRHEGVDLPRVDFDRMVKTAGSQLAARQIQKCLKLTAEEERFRFGFAV
ncbi:MAG: hypothetical protein ACO1QS_13035 [Verrucomicrobiota bacterium]